jgi:hypothetical protein
MGTCSKVDNNFTKAVYIFLFEKVVSLTKSLKGEVKTAGTKGQGEDRIKSNIS